MAITDIGFAMINPQQPNSNPNQPTNLFAPYASVGQTPTIPGIAAFSDQFTETDHVVSLKGSQTFDTVTAASFVGNLTGNVVSSGTSSFDTIKVKTITAADGQSSIAITSPLNAADIGATFQWITATDEIKGIYTNGIQSYNDNKITFYDNLVTATGKKFVGPLQGNVTGDVTGDIISSGISKFAEISAYNNSAITFNHTVNLPLLKTNNISSVHGDAGEIAVSGDLNLGGCSITAYSFIGNVVGNVTGNLTGDASGANLQYTNGSITNLSVQHLELQSGTEIEFESALSENAIIVTNSNGEPLEGGTNSGLVIITGRAVAGAYPAEAAPLYDSTNDALVLGQGTYYGANYSDESKRNTFEFGLNQKQLLATRSSNITNGNLLKWDNEHHTIVDAGTLKTLTVRSIAISLLGTGTVNLDNYYVSKTSNASRIYGTDSTGAQTLYLLGSSSGDIARYGGSSTGTVSSGGYLLTNTPVNSYQAANKKYVDDNLSVIQDWTV